MAANIAGSACNQYFRDNNILLLILPVATSASGLGIMKYWIFYEVYIDDG